MQQLWTSVTMSLGTAHESMQPQLFGFLQFPASFKFSAKHGTKRLTQSAATVEVKVIRNSQQTFAIFSAQAVQRAR